MGSGYPENDARSDRLRILGRPCGYSGYALVERPVSCRRVCGNFLSRPFQKGGPNWAALKSSKNWLEDAQSFRGALLSSARAFRRSPGNDLVVGGILPPYPGPFDDRFADAYWP